MKDVPAGRHLMRVYSSMWAVVLTAGSASVAELAVSSAGFERVPRPSLARREPPPTGGQLWYGGVLDPITIEVKRTPRPALAFEAMGTRSVMPSR
jgi:hypothetical protein